MGIAHDVWESRCHECCASEYGPRFRRTSAAEGVIGTSQQRRVSLSILIADGIDEMSESLSKGPFPGGKQAVDPCKVPSQLMIGQGKTTSTYCASMLATAC